MEGFSEEVTKYSAAALVGKDELGLKASLEGFQVAPTEALEKMLLDMSKFESPAKVEGSFVRFGPDEFMVVVHHGLSDAVFLLWIEEEQDTRTFVNEKGQEITFRPKRLTGFRPMGAGEAAEEEAMLLIREIREGLELVAMRTLGGFARAESDGHEDTATLEEQADEMRRLMEE